MARRKKSEKTHFRTSTARYKPQKYRKRETTANRAKTEEKTDLGGVTTVIISLAVLIALIVWNSVRGTVYTPADDKLRVHFVDVGQGDCIYISCGDESMLIDCGEKSEHRDVIRYLNREEVTKLKYVIATHPHSDHMGGMSKILEEFPTEEVIIPPLTKEAIPLTYFFEDFVDVIEEKNITLTEAKVGMKGKIGDAEWRIISPTKCDEGNLNNCSVSIILKHGRNNFCLTGDSEEEAEKTMAYSGVTEDVDVFKAAHHGGATSNTELFLTMIRPEIVVISCGEDNSYGHPNPEVLKRFETYADEIYRTDEDGNVVIESDGEELNVLKKEGSLW